ncbi:MAG: extracellular solute-binding protein [Ruminococcaceae bacterium]|nr:extracellular solute-binding protein [Oscillospiraceae bacterium]
MKIRILSLILAAFMVICLLPSCGEAKPEKPTNVFRETKIEVPEFLGSDFNINRYEQVGDTLYMMMYVRDESRAYQYFIVDLDLNTGKFGEPIDLNFPQPENGSSSVNNFTVGDDGTLYIMIDHYTYGEGYTHSVELQRIQNGVSEDIDLGSMIDEETGEEFYIYTMKSAPDGSLILVSWNGMRIVTPDGQMHDVPLDYDYDEAQIEGMQKIGDKLYLQMWTYSEESSGVKLVEFDYATGELGDELDISSDHVYSLILGPGYDYYYNDRSSLWGVTFGDAENMVEVLNFINSDINTNDLRNILPISSDRFFMTTRTYLNGRNQTEFMFLDRVPDEEVVEKKLLRLAAAYVPYDLRAKVIAFNKSNDEYRITVDDYSRYNNDDNYNAGTEKLNSDIISGNIPDIFLMNSQSPYDVYASKGIFANLYELMDADEDFDRSEYVESIFKAYEYDGELLSLVTAVQITTFAAKESLTEGMDGWNMDEFLAFAKAHPDMQMFDIEFNRESFLRQSILFSRDQFIDKNTGETHFDSDAFRQLLEFAKSMPEDYYWNTMEDEDYTPEFYEELNNRFIEDRVLLAQWYLYDIQYSYKELLNYSLKSIPNFIGFPVEDGNGAMMQSSGDTEYAIARRSDFKEGAWEFLKTLISEDAQMPFYNDEHGYWDYPVYGIPVYRPALEKQFEIVMTPPEEEDFDYGYAVPAEAYAVTESAEKVAVSDETVSVETEIVVMPEVEVLPETEVPDVDVWVDPYSIPLTDAQVDQLRDLIDNTTQVMRNDEKLLAIILEEAAAYFDGTKSLDETVNIIENRAGIYVNESR